MSLIRFTKLVLGFNHLEYFKIIIWLQYFQAKFKEKGSELASDQLAQLSKQLDSFKGNLEDFAAKHRNDIKKNPEFRRQFQEMCAAIGVDPLACEFSCVLLTNVSFIFFCGIVL